MKKILVSLLITFTLTCLFGCVNNGINPDADIDFDGLKNSIDPEPENNVYKFQYLDENLDPYTNEDSFKVDYREFFNDDLETKYNVHLAKLGAIITMGSYDKTIKILNNEYITPSSEISEILTLIGCDDITPINFNDDGLTNDIYDKCKLVLGHHSIEFSNKKYNITFIQVIGYENTTGWASNFDVGANTQDYVDTTGEHLEWDNKNTHKGFQVTANRAYSHIENYLNQHKIDNYTDFVFIAGHSRGAAITSLIGKKLKDNNIKSICYAYNSPTHVCNISNEECESYTNIWQIFNENDFVSQVPLTSWNGFTYLGHKLSYNMEENKTKYDSYFIDRHYPTIDPKLNPMLLSIFENMVENREALYVFRPAHPEYKEVLLDQFNEPFDSEEEALDEIDNLYNAFPNPENAKKIIEMVVATYSQDNTKYQINFRTKPHIIVSCVGDITKDTSIPNILDVLLAYLPFFSRYLSEMDEKLDYVLDNLTQIINQIFMAHEQTIMLIACTLL